MLSHDLRSISCGPYRVERWLGKYVLYVGDEMIGGFGARDHAFMAAAAHSERGKE